MHRFALLLAAVLTLFTGTAEATQQGNMAIANWKRMDDCAKQAQAAFPDHTADSNAKRDAKLNECLSSGNLPPMAPSQPPQTR